MLCFAAGTRQDRVTTEVYAVNTVYEEIVTSGETRWQTVSVIPQKTQMGISGTSPTQVIDLSSLVIDGYFTFQFKSITGVTDAPLGVSGATISVHWRGSNEDKPSSWVQATQNTIVDAINVFSGITNVAYDINDITGVTPFNYFRIEYTAGTATGVTPVGKLFIR